VIKGSKMPSSSETEKNLNISRNEKEKKKISGFALKLDSLLSYLAEFLPPATFSTQAEKLRHLIEISLEKRGEIPFTISLSRADRGINLNIERVWYRSDFSPEQIESLLQFRKTLDSYISFLRGNPLEISSKDGNAARVVREKFDWDNLQSLLRETLKVAREGHSELAKEVKETIIDKWCKIFSTRG
jgi:hypothetical protein